MHLLEGLLSASLLLVGVATATAQLFLPVSLTAPPVGPPLVYNGHPGLIEAEQRVAPLQLEHRDVVLASEAESHLPPQLKNPFYRNPRIAQALAKESWFGPGEVHVTMRETEKIPRGKIISVLKNAGLARRRR